MNDRMDGKISKLERTPYFDEIETMLQEMISESDHLKFMGFTKPGPPWYRRRSRIVGIVVSVLVFAIVAVFAAIDAHNHPDTRTITGTPVTESRPTFSVSWTDQAAVPPARLGPSGAETGPETVAAFTRDYTTNLINLLIGPTVTVPRDQQVIVVARQNGQPGVAQPAMDANGKLTQKCTIQTGGTLKQIASEGSRSLVIYVPPVANAAVGPMWCTSNDMFYERL